jgi:hypothetical protein
MGLLKDQARANHVGDGWICTARRWEGCWLGRGREGKGGGMSGRQDMEEIDVINLWHQCCLLYTSVESRYLQYLGAVGRLDTVVTCGYGHGLVVDMGKRLKPSSCPPTNACR